jgi:uncharacterized membrane protein
MRKILETISLVALIALAFLTRSALRGPHRLPDKIPTHFDMTGHANGWDSPASLLLLPIVALGIYLLITVLSRFPALFNFPVEVTDQNRARLQALAWNMIAWIKAEMLCLFAWIQWMTIQAARMPDGGFSPASGFMVGTFGLVALLLFTIAWFIVAMLRAKQAQPLA